jgi:hypothetical protein
LQVEAVFSSSLACLVSKQSCDQCSVLASTFGICQGQRKNKSYYVEVDCIIVPATHTHTHTIYLGQIFHLMLIVSLQIIYVVGVVYLNYNCPYIVGVN